MGSALTHDFVLRLTFEEFAITYFVSDFTHGDQFTQYSAHESSCLLFSVALEELSKV